MQKLVIPRKDLTSVNNAGVCIFSIAVILLGSGKIPSLDNTWSANEILLAPKTHFDGEVTATGLEPRTT